MLLTTFLSYVAGLLTALAPCVLPLLPIILGGSLAGDKKDTWRPYIITASLVVSLILFTILLKVSTALIGIDPRVWAIGSGVLVIILGFFMLFPNLWAQGIGMLGIEHRSQGLLSKAYKQENSVISAILIGAALGPIFSSCSPTYAWVIATVLPSSVLLGMFYLTFYVLGVASALLAIALLGRRLLARIKWASNPKGLFQRIIAILFIIVGIFVATGFDKKVQTYLVDKDFLNLTKLEKNLVPNTNSSPKSNTNKIIKKAKFNITPYDAPELQNIAAWINSNPQTISELKGKVVLIDFWTYSCINCQRTQPYLNAWYDKYRQDGFEIIGVHAPEFAFEKVLKNVQDAVKDENIKYPVALDNDFASWRAYENQYWPAKYLIDKDGQVRYTHFGEGEYTETEQIIQALLKESGNPISNSLEKVDTSDTSVRNQTPETYLGYVRAERFANAGQFIANMPVEYALQYSLKEHEWSLGGKWQVNEEASQSVSRGATLAINFSAKDVYIVMDGPIGSMVEVSVDGLEKPGGKDVDAKNQVQIDGARLYKVVDAGSYLNNKRLTITLPSGILVHAITFGS